MNSATGIQSSTENVMTLRQNAVVMMYLIQAGWGVVQVFMDDLFVVNFMVVLAMATCATAWFVLDRKIFGGAREPIMEVLVFLTWPITTLIYLFNSRGEDGVLYWVLHAVGLIMTCVASSYLVWLVALALGLLGQPAA